MTHIVLAITHVCHVTVYFSISKTRHCNIITAWECSYSVLLQFLIPVF